MISNITVQQVYTTNGIVLNFPIPFAFLPEDPEAVTKVYKVDLVTGVKTLQHLGALNDYTLPHDIDTDPANVVFNAAPNNCYVLVTRLLDIEQNIAFLNSGAQLLTNIEDGMDILTMLIQQVNEKAKRAITLNDVDSVDTFDTNFPPHLNMNPGVSIIVNETGTGFALGPTADDIADAEAFALQAALSASDSENAATASLGHAQDSANSADDSAVSAAAAAVSAAAAAASAAQAGFTSFNVAFLDGQTDTQVPAEVFNGLTVKGVYYIFMVLRGTTVAAQGAFGFSYKNGTWTKSEGLYEGDLHGMTWGMDQTGTSGTFKFASDTGAGNGTIYLKRAQFLG